MGFMIRGYSDSVNYSKSIVNIIDLYIYIYM